jgi:hypothetical protein
MRITRAYTITSEVKKILDRKPNKSDFVCRAVMKLHNNEIKFEIGDMRTRQLIAALHQREDCPKHIKLLLWDELTK